MICLSLDTVVFTVLLSSPFQEFMFGYLAKYVEHYNAMSSFITGAGWPFGILHNKFLYFSQLILTASYFSRIFILMFLTFNFECL